MNRFRRVALRRNHCLPLIATSQQKKKNNQ
jgi:hypothetical protein